MRLAEHSHHGTVDPEVDGPELGLRAVGGTLDGLPVGDIRGDADGALAEGLDIRHRAGEPLLPAREHGDIPAVARQLAHDGASESGRAARDDGDSSCGALVGHVELPHRDVTPPYEAPPISGHRSLALDQLNGV
jgi:hypothetical protein